MVDVKLKKSEVTLVKKYCSRASDRDLALLADCLPQTMMGDRAAACEVLQGDKEIDMWLSAASGADEWFFKADSIGDFASIEIEARSKKAK